MIFSADRASIFLEFRVDLLYIFCKERDILILIETLVLILLIMLHMLRILAKFPFLFNCR